MKYPQKRILYLTTVAALGSTLPTMVTAFAPPTLPSVRPVQTRLYSSNDNGGGGILGGLKNMAKKVLPKKFTQSKEERKSEIQRKEQKNAIRGGLNQILKDAPLPVRMLGGMIAPIVGSMVSGMAEMVQSQQQQMEMLLADAQGFIAADPGASSALGEPFMVQAPFSQSSSSSSINGQTSTNIQSSFYVVGSNQQGTATMIANENGIQQLTLQVGGRNLDIQLLSKSRIDQSQTPSGSSIGKNRINKNDIIDVEFTEKKSNDV